MNFWKDFQMRPRLRICTSHVTSPCFALLLNPPPMKCDNPSRPSYINSVYSNRCDRTFPICHLQLWWSLLRYCDSSGIITMLFCRYLMEHGCSRFIRNFMLSIKSSNKKKRKRELCFITRPPPVIYRLTLTTCDPTLSVCADIRAAGPSAATSPLD